MCFFEREITMKTALKGLALAGLLMATAGTALAGVTVSFTHPEKYADLPFASWERQEVLDQLAAHFQKLAGNLPPDVDVRIEVLDVDLAGRSHQQFHGARDLRVLNGRADWPVIDLRYTVEQGGKVIASGEERLRDMMYLDHSNRYYAGDALRYEKKMIDEWFNQRIVAKRAG